MHVHELSLLTVLFILFVQCSNWTWQHLLRVLLSAFVNPVDVDFGCSIVQHCAEL